MIKLNEESSFAEGGNRKCFISPQDPNRCLKVIHKGLQENLKKMFLGIRYINLIITLMTIYVKRKHIIREL